MKLAPWFEFDGKSISWKFEFQEDIEKIKEIMKTGGVEVTDLEAYCIWDLYSHSMCAGWLDPCKNDTFERVMKGCLDHYPPEHT